MSNPNVKPRFTKENAKEIGRKGGLAKRGKVSIKNAIKRLLASGEVDVDQVAKSLLLNMMKGNSGIAKIVMEYNDGKVPDKLEVKNKDYIIVTPELKDMMESDE